MFQYTLPPQLELVLFLFRWYISLFAIIIMKWLRNAAFEEFYLVHSSGDPTDHAGVRNSVEDIVEEHNVTIARQRKEHIFKAGKQERLGSHNELSRDLRVCFTSKSSPPHSAPRLQLKKLLWLRDKQPPNH
jgi:hypothetical protein